METKVDDILSLERDSVVAPAGCGKTQLITDALIRSESEKPILVLTHTNAGVAALRARLDRAHVSRAKYRISTIDGWCIRIAATFPGRAGLDPAVLRLARPSVDYPTIRRSVIGLLKSRHIDDILQATYARLLVDEYQDCSLWQHCVVGYASNVLPTCVLGDPLQAIFGFGEDVLPNWDEVVCKTFPVAFELTTPWRWINAGAESLGWWLLDVRQSLLEGAPIDLSTAPSAVKWVKLEGRNDSARQLNAGRGSADRTVLIIGESTSPGSQRMYASQTPGAVAVESVDLRDLVNFAKSWEVNSESALVQLHTFAQTLIADVGEDALVERVALLRHNDSYPRVSAVESAALRFVSGPSYALAADLVNEMITQPGARVHRPSVASTLVSALRSTPEKGEVSFLDRVIRAREDNRLVGRTLPRRAVGSTLLLKGLEADVSVILDADTLDAENLYVAMTRGARQLVICSRSPVLVAKRRRS